MLDAFYLLISVDEFTLITAVGSVAVVFWLIRQMVESTMLAVVCAPVLILGALAANYLFRSYFVIASQDKDANVVVASAIGVLAALLLMLIGIWISASMSERRARKPMTLPDLPPAGE